MRTFILILATVFLVGCGPARPNWNDSRFNHSRATPEHESKKDSWYKRSKKKRNKHR